MKIQNIDFHDLAKEYQTPFYVYDADVIEAQVQRMKNAFSHAPLKMKYAVKALSNISILKLMNSLGVGLDTVSINEVHLGLKAGVVPEEILFTPNSIDFDELKAATELGVVINIDNISLLEQFGSLYGNSRECCIRLNPHLMAGGNSKISTGHIDSKFGISIYQMRHVERIVKTYDLKISGLHVHTGSDILNPDVFLEVAEIIFSMAPNFKDLKFIDFGSGFKVSYREGDIVTNIEELAEKLVPRFLEFCKDYGRELELWFEPGKFLVSESGSFITKVNTVKTTPATVFVGVNSGFNHLIRPMMYDAYHAIENISNPNGTERVYTVVGYICETDTFGSDRKLAEVKEGDLLRVKNAGAYSYSMASNYNSRLRPPEILIHKGKSYLIRKREQFEDLIKDQIEVSFKD